ncbi:penicillin-binding protein PBP2A [Streptococcus halotolerans]|uniref:penicillin-binding protein PBP2A n=1 Tax=Streptococcus halotolerans TaxID=1814128 RepID=UPI000789541D|nr:penicillin-binding protein PBP2A [Streptococcus halotolerans]
MTIFDKWKKSLKNLLSTDKEEDDRDFGVYDLDDLEDYSDDTNADETQVYQGFTEDSSKDNKEKSRRFDRSSRHKERAYHGQRDRLSLSERLIKKYPKLAIVRRLIPARDSWIRRFWRRYHIGKIILLIGAIFSLVVGSYLFYLAKTADVEDLQSALKATTLIYDKNEEQVGSLSGQKGTYVELDAISDNLKKAVISTEDRSFYKNNGINFSRFALAIVTMGKFGGGSTITQQLAKNAYLSQEQTITRKAKEFFLALELTKQYSKDEILTMYLNNAYFGNSVWGIEDASHKYFGVSAAELTLEQSAILAGMLKGPEVYNPLYSIKNATNRRDTVLGVMVDAKVISQREAEQAASVDISRELADNYGGTSDTYQYPSYFDAVIQEATQKYGLTEDDIVNKGYKIYTELDQNYQVGMQYVYDDTSYFPVAEDGESSQGASVAMDPKTGAVRGLVGRVSSTSQSFRSFNYATQAKRSPGSAIKPLVAYAPAVANGYSIHKLLPNTPIDYKGYRPENFGGYESEDVPMYQALANSYNVPAVYLVDKLGLSKAFSYGKKFGLNMSAANRELGVALGGSVTTSPLEIAQAYATFANNGVMPKAHLITRIETASGKIIKQFKESNQRVISQSVSKKMTSMMLGTFSNGSAVNANAYGYTMAGKTGTTETKFNPDLTSDQWVVGYTPDIVLSQWIGFEKTDENHYLTGASSGTASTIFSAVASNVLPHTAGSSFDAENAYISDGVAPTYTANPAEAEESVAPKVSNIFDDLKKGAESAKNNFDRAVQDANLEDKARRVWNAIESWLN